MIKLRDEVENKDIILEKLSEVYMQKVNQRVETLKNDKDIWIDSLKKNLLI